MADKFTRFLQGVGSGLLNPKGNLGDARHAARLYTDHTFARAPRTKFMYYVYFELNAEAVRSASWKLRHQLEAGLLVKSADLPKITMEHEIKNMYNKKKVVYKDIKFEPLNLQLHDDNLGITNSLYALYYGYHSPERFLDTATAHADPGNASGSPYWKTRFGARYGLDQNGSDQSFFKSIQIYTLARKSWNGYKLINPRIVNWSHGQVDQSASNGTMESSMTVVYESVMYGQGVITKNGKLPPQFGTIHYDKTPSPLSLGGGVNPSIFGLTGVFGQADEILADSATIFKDYYEGGDAAAANAGILQTALKAVNFYKSVASISKESLIADATNLLLSPNAISNVTSGLPGVNFGGPNANTFAQTSTSAINLNNAPADTRSR
jgi:hypothetical protein